MSSLEKQVKYQQAIQSANELKSKVAQIRDVLNEVNRTRPVVESNWSGHSQQGYLDNFFQTAAKFEPFCNYVNSYADNIIQAAESFLQLDNNKSVE